MSKSFAISSTETKEGYSGHATHWITSSIGIQFFTKIIKGFILPKFLSPSIYGLYNSLIMVLTYGRFADLGVTQLMAKDLPSILTREGEESFQQRLSLGFSWILMSAGVVALLVASLTFFQDGPYSGFYRIGFPLIAAAIFVNKIRLLLGTTVRAREWFRILSLGSITFSVAGLVLAVVFLIAFGVIGLVVSLILSEVISLIYYLRFTGLPTLSRIKWKIIKSLLAGGIILLLLLISELIITTVDRLFLLAFYTKAEFGLYSLGLFISTTLLSISGIYLTIIHPKMMRHIETGNEQEAHRLMNRSLVAYFSLVVFALPIGFVLLYGFVHWYIPDYASGLSLYILLSGMAIVRGPVLLFQPYFIARSEEKKILLYYIFSIVLAGVLDAAVVILGGNMKMIVLASITAYTLLIAILSIVFERRSAEPIEWTKYTLLLLGGGIVGGFFALHELIVSQMSIMNGMVQLGNGACIALILAVVIGWVHRDFIKESLRYFWIKH